MASKIAAQLYTVREFCQTPDDFAETVQKVREIGYESAQLSGHGEIDPEFIKEACDAADLNICATHIGFDMMRDDLAGTVELHEIYDCTYAGIGGAPQEYQKSAETWSDFAKEASEVAAAMAEHGLVFVYHNHSHELEKYEDGRTALQIMMEDGDPEYFNFEPDVYWLQHGGGSPVAWLKEMGERAPVIHFKDMTMHGREQVFAEIGEGNLDWDGIVAACEEIGAEYYIVEQDQCERDPFESLKISYDNMREMGIE